MAAFTPGNIVVYRVGTVGGGALTSAATQVFLDEYTPGGVLIQSIALPIVDSGSNQTLTAAGTSTSEGMMTLSVNGRYLVLTGYDAAVGTASVSSTAAASVARVIGRVAADGTIDTSTALTDFSTGGSPRGVASVDGLSFYVDGAAGGIRYASFGATTSTQLSTTVTNLRSVEIYDGQLYVSSGSGTTRVATVGTGVPTTNGQTITNLPGFPTTGSPYQFYLADLTAAVAGVDTLYVADDGAGAGIQKYSLVAGTWVSNGSVTASGVRGLTATTVGVNVSLFATSASTLFSFSDTTGYNATISGSATTLTTAGAGTAFRGIAFAPQNVGGAATLTINDPTVVEGNSGTTTLVFTVTSNVAAGAAGISFSFATADGTATAGVDYIAQSGTGTIASGATQTTISIVVNSDTTIEGNETILVNLTNPTNATIADPQGAGTITNDDFGLIPIYSIQGLGHRSGFVGQTVSTSGIVTAVDTNGFYLQDPTGDGNIGTSDGIFVFTSSAPTVAVGNAITLNATVTEFTGSTAGSLSLTQLTSPTSIVVTSAVNALPAPVLISTDGTPGSRTRQRVSSRTTGSPALTRPPMASTFGNRSRGCGSRSRRRLSSAIPTASARRTSSRRAAPARRASTTVAGSRFRRAISIQSVSRSTTIRAFSPGTSLPTPRATGWAMSPASSTTRSPNMK